MRGDPPTLKFSPSEPLQDYYDDGHGNRYSVAKLLDATRDLPVFDCPLAALDLDHEIWAHATMFDLAWHVKKVIRADLRTSILLDWVGRVADGRHRIIKALMQGKRTIPARRMTWRPEPDAVTRRH